MNEQTWRGSAGFGECWGSPTIVGTWRLRCSYWEEPRRWRRDVGRVQAREDKLRPKDGESTRNKNEKNDRTDLSDRKGSD